VIQWLETVEHLSRFVTLLLESVHLVCRSVCQTASCDFAVQKWMNKSGSCLGWRFLEPRNIVLYVGSGPSMQYSGGCKLHPNQAKGGTQGEFGRQLYDTTPHYITHYRITNNKLLSYKSPWVTPWLVGYLLSSDSSLILKWRSREFSKKCEQNRILRLRF